MYYLRSQAATDAIKFTIDTATVKEAKTKTEEVKKEKETQQESKRGEKEKEFREFKSLAMQSPIGSPTKGMFSFRVWGCLITG